MVACVACGKERIQKSNAIECEECEKIICEHCVLKENLCPTCDKNHVPFINKNLLFQREKWNLVASIVSRNVV